MRVHGLKLKNTAKNLILLVLVLLMGVLMFLSWLLDLNANTIPRDTVWGRLYQQLRYGTSGFELRSSEMPAALPVKIAVSVNGSLLGAQYQNASVDALYSALSVDMGEALVSLKELHGCGESDFRKALQGESLYFGYAGMLPVKLLSGWMGGSTVDISLQTDMLLINEDGKLFMRDEAGNYFCAKVTVNPENWKGLGERPSVAACAYAGALDDPVYEHLLPDTLIFDNDLQMVPDYYMTRPDFVVSEEQDGLTGLLAAFGYDPYVYNYEESNGTEKVYVNGNSTLSVRQNGTIEFRATTIEGGIPAYDAGSISENKSLLYCVDAARSLLENVQNSIGAHEQVYFHGVTQSTDEKDAVLLFAQSLGGVPVTAKETEPFARFEFSGNRMVGATIRLCKYEAAEGKTVLIPVNVAAAAAADGTYGLTQIYVPGEDDVARASRYFWTY